MSELFDLVIRATLLLGVALAGWWMLKGRSAQLRSTWLRAVILALVALPLWIWAGPEFHFEVPFAEKPAPVMMLTTDGAPIAANPGMSWGWLWGAVALLLALRMTLGGAALARMWSRAKPVNDDLTDELYQALARLEVARPVDFRLAAVNSPMTFGIRRACVVVPSNFESWPQAHREAALMHEAAHIRRFDCGWQWLATTVRAMLWCHPLVWWLASAIRDEAELAADERVIAAGVEPTDYATALVEIARTQVRGPVPAAAAALLREGQLSRRVTSALHSRRGGFTPVASMGLMAAAMAAVVALGGLQPQLPKADVLVVREDVQPVVFNFIGEEEGLPVELDDIVVPIDAGLAPLPQVKSKKSAPLSTKPKTLTLKRVGSPATPKVDISAPVGKPKLGLLETTTEISVEYAGQHAIAPNAKETRRVIVVSSDREAKVAMAPKAQSKTFAYHFVSGAEAADFATLKDLEGLKNIKIEIPDMAGFPLEHMSAAEREEFKRHMEQMSKELGSNHEFKLMVSEVEAKKLAEAAKKLTEEARASAPVAPTRTIPLPPLPPGGL